MKIDQRDADAALGGEIHSRPSWILPAILLVVAAALGGVAWYVLTGPTVEELQGNTLKPTASADAADIRIDGVLFRVPANYTKFSRSRSSGDHDDLPLHVLLPDMTPWREADRAAFASNAPDARVVHLTLAIDRAKLTYEQKFERGIKPLADNPEGTPGPFGLTQFKFGPGTGYENTEWFSAKLGDGHELVMRCDVAAQPEFGPSCLRATRTADNVGVSYRFKRAHLAQWREIDAGVMRVIASFRPK
jgi:hypothetical protein